MNDASTLAHKTCVPCRGGVPTLTGDQIEKLRPQVPAWTVIQRDGIQRIERAFVFKDFVAAMRFVNRVADLAQSEGHHPDLHIHWNKVVVELWTHKILGLHENDFIVAAKVDAIEDHTER